MTNQNKHFQMESNGNQRNLEEIKFQETVIEKNPDGFMKTTIQSFEGTPEEVETIINNNNL
jgi:hypothetical protein